MLNTQPVLIITRDSDLATQLRELAPDVHTVTGVGPGVAAAHWHTAPAVLIGADVLAEMCAAQPEEDNRAGIYVVTTADGPHAYLSNVATLPGDVVELAQPDAPAWLAARLRHLAAGGDPGTPPNGCEECGAAPGKPCTESNCQGTWH